MAFDFMKRHASKEFRTQLQNIYDTVFSGGGGGGGLPETPLAIEHGGTGADNVVDAQKALQMPKIPLEVKNGGTGCVTLEQFKGELDIEVPEVEVDTESYSDIQNCSEYSIWDTTLELHGIMTRYGKMRILNLEGVIKPEWTPDSYAEFCSCMIRLQEQDQPRDEYTVPDRNLTSGFEVWGAAYCDPMGCMMSANCTIRGDLVMESDYVACNINQLGEFSSAEEDIKVRATLSWFVE